MYARVDEWLQFVKVMSVQELSVFNDVELLISVEFGRAEVTIKDLLKLSRGSVLEVDKMSGEPVDLRVNGRMTARGEVVVVNDHYGIRVTEIVSPEGLNLIESRGE